LAKRVFDRLINHKAERIANGEPLRIYVHGGGEGVAGFKLALVSSDGVWFEVELNLPQGADSSDVLAAELVADAISRLNRKVQRAGASVAVSLIALASAIVRVRLHKVDVGSGAEIPSGELRCRILFDDKTLKSNEGIILFNEARGSFHADGKMVVVPLVFLWPDRLTDKFCPGARFTLWQLKKIGVGEVLELPDQS